MWEPKRKSSAPRSRLTQVESSHERNIKECKEDAEQDSGSCLVGLKFEERGDDDGIDGKRDDGDKDEGAVHFVGVEKQEGGIEPNEAEDKEGPDEEFGKKGEREEGEVDAEMGEACKAEADDHHAQDGVGRLDIFHEVEEVIGEREAGEVDGEAQEKGVEGGKTVELVEELFAGEGSLGAEVEAESIFKESDAQKAHDVDPCGLLVKEDEGDGEAEEACISIACGEGEDVAGRVLPEGATEAVEEEGVERADEEGRKGEGEDFGRELGMEHSVEDDERRDDVEDHACNGIARGSDDASGNKA